MNSVISLKAALPLGLVIVIIGAAVHIASIKALGVSNKLQVKELKYTLNQTHKRIHDIEKTLYRIEGKLDLYLKNK